MARKSKLQIFKSYEKEVPKKPRRERMKRLRRLPIVLPLPPGIGDDGVVEKLPKIAHWKRAWLAHWFSLEFRGRIKAVDYARLHGVSVQAVTWLIKVGRLGAVTRDGSARYWVRADWPYPEAVTRVGGYARRGAADLSIRALHYSDFVQVGHGRSPNAATLDAYCKEMNVYPRETLEDVRNPDDRFVDKMRNEARAIDEMLVRAN